MSDIHEFITDQASPEVSAMHEGGRRDHSVDLLLCIACFMACALDASWLTMPQNYGLLAAGSSDWISGAFYHVLFGSPMVLLVMVSGIFLLAPERQVTLKELWGRYILKYAAAYVFWCLIYALYRIRMMDPQPDVDARFLLQQWMAEPAHLWYLPLMIGLFVLVPLFRPITASGNTKLFLYMVILFAGTMAVVMIYTWPNLPHGEHYIYPAIGKTPILMIGQYIFWILFGWIAYNHRPSGSVRALLYVIAVIAVIAGTVIEQKTSPYPFGLQIPPVAGEFSLISFCKNTALFYLIISVAGSHEFSHNSGIVLQRLAGCTLTIYLIHYLILSILYDHGFLYASGTSAWIGVWVYAIVAYAVGAVIALIIQGICSGMKKVFTIGTKNKRTGLLLSVMILAVLMPMAVFAGNEHDDAKAAEKQEVSATEFEDSHIQLKSRSRSTDQGVVIVWDEVKGAKEYQVYRAAKRDGEYELFGTTEDTRLKKDTDGEYYYKVRAYNGETYSKWSRIIRILSQSGHIKKMYYDDYGYTHFLIHVNNRSGRSLYFFGPGLYNSSRTPLYRVCKYEIRTEVVEGEEKIVQEDIEYPYPLTAAPQLSMYQCRKVRSEGGGEDIDVYVPWKLPKYGEDGLKNEKYGYRVEISAFPDQRMPGFALSVTGDEKESEARGRMDR